MVTGNDIAEAYRAGQTQPEIDSLIQQHLTDWSIQMTVDEWKTMHAALIERWSERTGLKTYYTSGGVVTLLVNSTHPQIDTWVDNNVTNLAQSKDLFKVILKLVRGIIKTGIAE